MLAKRHRLAKQQDILSVLRGGDRLHTPYATIYVKANKTTEHFRAAVVAGKKVHALAVRRHRYQRWLREVVHTHAKTLPAVDIVVVATPRIVDIASYSALKKELDPILQKIKSGT